MVIIMAMAWERLNSPNQVELGERILVTDEEHWQEVVVAKYEKQIVFMEPATRALIPFSYVTHFCRVQLPRQ